MRKKLNVIANVSFQSHTKLNNTKEESIWEINNLLAVQIHAKMAVHSQSGYGVTVAVHLDLNTQSPAHPSHQRNNYPFLGGHFGGHFGG